PAAMRRRGQRNLQADSTKDSADICRFFGKTVLYMQQEIIQKSRILLIDDLPANVLLLSEILRGEGYSQIRSVTDSRLALAAFSEFQPDLVALDLGMPHLDGFEFLKQVRSLIPEGDFVPILVLTGDASAKAKRDALTLGARDFLTKPLDLTEVRLRIYNLLEIRWLHANLREANQTLEERVRARTREAEEAQLEILHRLALASDLRDDVTGEHTERVGWLAALLAQIIGLSQDQVQLIYRAAPLHDVGKIGIPDHILLKPGALTTDEWERIKRHTEMGGQLLSGSRFQLLQMAERIARYHHERWDGKGYQGLAGDAIPLEARIVSIVDTFDVITHERPYKAAESVEVAIAKIREQRGKQFDPNLVDAFVRVEPEKDLNRLRLALEREQGIRAAQFPVHTAK
ncbi:MAG: two-component system response regulator, partial [Bryobacterales bacterium]|nr:two-component system response regulator [Bryobacterales bacterium]